MLPTAVIARICHEANRAYCLAIGDSSQLPWDIASDWQRESAISGVTAYLNNPAMTPEETHELWLKEKRANGWVYGPIKDENLKQHPCCVPYSELSEDQRVKDKLFIAIVTAVSEK